MAPRTPKAIAERERLQGKLATLVASRDEATVKIKRAEAEIKTLNEQRRTQLAKQVNGDEAAATKVAAIDADIATKEREVEGQKELAEVASGQRQATRAAIRSLYVRSPDAFVGEAQEATDAAMDARQRLIDAFNEAEKLDRAARSAWQPVQQAAAEAGTGGYGKGSLGRMPGRPTLFETATSKLGIRGLRDAPPPAPEYAREDRISGIASLVPRAFRQVLGISDPPPKPEPDKSGAVIEVI